jgi:molybdopterin molybdotransferase
MRMDSTSPLVPVDQVIETLLDRARPIADEEEVALDDAAGRVLSREIRSRVDVPPTDNSAMDGYAVNVEDPSITEGGVYEISDRIPAGSMGQPLRSGSLARIFTGAPIPPGANAVVMQENTEVVDRRVKINIVPRRGENIRPKGQDVAVGDIVLEKGRRLRAQDLGLIASVGLPVCRVFRKLKIALMSTGDELVEPPGPALAGQIFNSNRYALAAMVKDLGMEVVDLGIVKDTFEATEAALLRGAAEADCVLSSGGVSVGEEDHVKNCVEKLGAIDIWRVAIKPGKPLAFGSVRDTPFFGLPGNPVSSFVTFSIIARPYLLKFQGAEQVRSSYVHARADFDMEGGARREYLRVRFEHSPGADTRVVKYGNQGSGIMSSVCWADGLAEIETGQKVRRGDMVKVFPV